MPVGDEAIWFDALELTLRRCQGDAFQRLFGALMAAAHGSEYVEVIPHGNEGDGGVDGYRLPDNTVYQCYGALNGRTSGIAYLKNKILSDFERARATCPGMRRWVFVHNLVTGLPRPLLDTLLVLRKEAAGLVEVDQFGLDQFRAMFATLSNDRRRRLLGQTDLGRAECRAPAFKILTVAGVNFVRLGSRNHEQNEKFSCALTVRLAYGDQPFTLLGIKAEYLAPDGCYCLNGDQSVLIERTASRTIGNYFDLQNPIASRGGLLLVEIVRTLRPPLMIQTPADCDYGDVVISAKLLTVQLEEKVFVRSFQFELGGHLRPIEAPRAPPILSDDDLAQMLDDGVITQDEFDRANWTDQVGRYQIVCFGSYMKTMFLKEGGQCDVTDSFRIFLEALWKRAIRWAQGDDGGKRRGTSGM